MKTALTVWNERVSPVFDVSREALVLTIVEGAVVARSIENIETPTTATKGARVAELGVDTLVCGAITEHLLHEMNLRGIEVIGFVAGGIDEVVASLLAGTLPNPALSMPGCCGRQNRFRGGRHRSSRPGGGPGRRRRS